jgi:hypothetical protein
MNASRFLVRVAPAIANCLTAAEADQLITRVELSDPKLRLGTDRDLELTLGVLDKARSRAERCAAIEELSNSASVLRRTDINELLSDDDLHVAVASVSLLLSDSEGPTAVEGLLQDAASRLRPAVRAELELVRDELGERARSENSADRVNSG